VKSLRYHIQRECGSKSGPSGVAAEMLKAAGEVGVQ
jgi:hypothetical protein